MIRPKQWQCELALSPIRQKKSRLKYLAFLKIAREIGDIQKKENKYLFRWKLMLPFLMVLKISIELILYPREVFNKKNPEFEVSSIKDFLYNEHLNIDISSSEGGWWRSSN